ncbi:hypothetical protein JCM8547_005906 [Rhodosporidiobolus lusitaniae]
MPRQGLSQRARAIAQRVYNNRHSLPAGENWTRAILMTIEEETGEQYTERQLNPLIRGFPNYERRWLRYRHLPHPDLANQVLEHIRTHTDPPFEPTRKTVLGAMRRWQIASAGASHDGQPPLQPLEVHASQAGANDPYAAVARTAEELQPVSQAYPTPGILYFDHNLRILQPHEINHLSYNTQGHLVDAEGYPVTTQNL